MLFPDSKIIADNLKNIPGIERALTTPIIDVDQSKMVTVMERVILSLEKSVPTGCKDSLLVQIMTGKDAKPLILVFINLEKGRPKVSISAHYFAGIIRRRVANTLHTCDGKVSSELTKELAKIWSERTGVRAEVLEKLSATTESLYLEINEKIQDKVFQILQNVGGR